VDRAGNFDHVVAGLATPFVPVMWLVRCFTYKHC
jgi:hypothetical protein